MRSFETILLVKERLRQRSDQRRRSLVNRQRAVFGLLAVLLTGLAAAALGLAFFYASLTSGLPAVDELAVMLDPQSGSLLQPTRLYDRSGQRLIYTLENPGVPRRYLALSPNQPEALSAALVESVVALQDPGYWQRTGLRWEDLSDPQPRTIPEQLANTLLLYDEPPGLRKTLRLRLLADQMISRYGHTRVLEWYLNSASFGHLAYGADSAARLYLGKPASALNLGEAALLAAVLEAPALNPLDAPAAALERQQEILLRLLSRGAIRDEDYQAAQAAPLALAAAARPPESPALAFSGLALAQLSSQIDRGRIERGGLRIITSLDYDLQLQVNCTLQAQLSRLAGQGTPSGTCEAARLLPSLPLSSQQPASGENLIASVVLLDPNSGQVLALAGDTSLQGEAAVLRSHPAGSLQTPFLALAGFARSLNPASLVWDIPSALEGYSNPDGAYHGPVRLRTALANDYLVPLTQVLLQVGPGTLAATAQSAGLVSFSTPPDLRDTFFSGQPLNPLEIAHAYSVFASQGLLNGSAASPDAQPQPVLVLRVEDSASRPLETMSTSQTRAVASAQLAYLVHHVLADEAARWPSLGYPNPLEIGRPAGAKFGQADGGRSTWTAGYTRDMLAVVWAGSDDDNSAPPGAQPVAGIWHALMQYASREKPVQRWNMPAGVSQVEVCDPSGLLPTAQCPNIVVEVFLESNRPSGFDNLYRRFQINRETGRLATIFTPPELVEERTYLVVPPEAQEWSRLANLAVPPLDYDAIQAPPANPNARFASPAQFAYVRGEVELRGTVGGAGFASYSLQVGQGINPDAWVTILEPLSQPVLNGRLALWDTSSLNGLTVVRLLVVRQDQRVESAILQVTVDNTPPQVRVPYPLPGQVFNRASQDSVTLQAEVEDNIGLRRVEWWINGRRAGEQLEPPYAFIWPAAAGEHILEVRAYDLAGNETRSEQIPFSVR